jgi:hypothetical protein
MNQPSLLPHNRNHNRYKFMPPSFAYDVFLSHNSNDKPRVRSLAEKLRAAGLRLWFDEWVIRLGDGIYQSIE